MTKVRKSPAPIGPILALLCAVFALATTAGEAKASVLTAWAEWALKANNQSVAHYVLGRSSDPYTRAIAAAALHASPTGNGVLDLSQPAKVTGLTSIF